MVGKSKTLLLEDLPYELKTEIFEWLSNNDLLTIRMIGKEYQDIADSILKSRRAEIIIDSHRDCLCKITTVFTVFSNAKKVTFRKHADEETVGDAASLDCFSKVVKECKRTLRKLESIELDNNDFQVQHISLLPTIENLTKLSLKNAEIDDKCMSDLFRSLPELTSIRIESIKITGQCFSNIGSKVQSVSWFNRGFALKMLTFSINAANIRHLQYSNEQMLTGDTQKVIETVSRELCNLERLQISTDDVIFDLSQFKVNSLQSLDLTVFEVQEIIPDFRMQCVKRLTITLSNYNDTDLVTLLYKFPCIERFTLDFSYNFRYLENPLSTQVIEAIVDLMFLRCFTFVDKLYEHEQYLCDNGNNSILLLISALNFVECIELELISIDHSEQFYELKTDIELLAKKTKGKQRYILSIE